MLGLKYLSEWLEREIQYERLLEQVKANEIFSKVHKAVNSKDKVQYFRSKIMLVGHSAVGKTCTIASLLGKPFQRRHISTPVADAEQQIYISNVAVDRWKEVKRDPAAHILHEDFGCIAQNINRAKASAGQAAPIQSINTELKGEYRIDHHKIKEALPTPAKAPSRPIIKRIRNIGKSFPLKTRLPLSRERSPRHFDPNTVTLAVWDFGGQRVFHALHHLFLTRNGIYMLLFNIILMRRDFEEEYGTMSFWIESLRLHAPGTPVLIVGTRCKKIGAEVLKEIDLQLKDKLHRFDDLTFVDNEEDDLSFFPIDNSLGSKNERYLEPLKNRIEHIFQDESSEITVHGIGSKIRTAWIYFMDYLLQKYKTHVKYSQITSDGTEIGFTEAEIHKLLLFYSEVGAIVYFGKNNQETPSALFEYVVLRPQWLIEALAQIVYQPGDHTTNAKGAPIAMRTEVRRYEATGILSRKLLEYLWKGYQEERNFLFAVCRQMLIISEFPFNLGGQDVPDNMDVDKFLVPSILSNVKIDNVRPELPSENNQAAFYMQFLNFFPNGVFERIVCIFVSRSAQAEGGGAKFAKDGASVWFYKVPIILLSESLQKRVKVVIDRKLDMHFQKLLKFLEEILLFLSKDVFGEKLTSTLLLQGNAENVVAKVETVEEAFRAREKGKEEPVLAFNTRGVCEVSIFDHFRAALSVAEEVNDVYDCFLAHEWGTPATRFQTNDQVREIALKLQEANLRVWLHEFNLSEDLAQGILRGIESSKKTLVFITTRYLQRCEDPNNICSKEFGAAVRKSVNKVIPVVLEPALLDTRQWAKSKVGYQLGHKVLVDFSTTEQIDANFDELVKRIMVSVEP